MIIRTFFFLGLALIGSSALCRADDYVVWPVSKGDRSDRAADLDPFASEEYERRSRSWKELPNRTFRVSKVGKDKKSLLRLFTAIKIHETGLGNIDDNSSGAGSPKTRKGAQNRPSLDVGLLAYYRLGDNSFDDSANNRHGERLGGISPAEDRRGDTGGAYSFDGSDDHIKGPVFPDSASFSASIWLKIKEQSDRRQFIFHDGNSASGRDCFAQIQDGIVLFGTKDNDFLRTRKRIPMNQWLHLVCVADANNRTKSIWLNGVKAIEDSNWIGSANVGFHDRFTLGAYYGGGTHHYLAGCLDDVRIYNRSLSGEEILLLEREARPALTPGQGSSSPSKPLEMSLEVIKRLSSTSYIVTKKGSEQLYWFRSQQASNKVNGEFINSWAQLIEETKTYTTASGEKKMVRVIQEVDAIKEVDETKGGEGVEKAGDKTGTRPIYSQEQFIRELKSGRAWQVLLTDQCTLCKGSGEVNSVGEKRPCPGCYKGQSFYGRGSGESRTIVTVRW